MVGTFGTWQREYEERGLATFPFAASERRKHPLVRGYQRIGLPASRQLALKYPNADGLACIAGARNRLTVVDIDARGVEGERLLADVQREYGKSKLIVQTGGGGFHAYYRHAGEGRKIRLDPRRPIDLLGGGPIVLPPSRGMLAPYRIVEGTIDDLTALTSIQTAQAPDNEHGARFEDLRTAQIGARDKKFWPYIKRYAHQAASYEDLLDHARELNEMLAIPLTDAEVVAKCRHWWRKTERGENKWGIGQFSTVDHSLIDELLMKDSDAFTLLMVLRRHHWGRSFAMANEMCTIMPEGGWRRQRFTAARDRLVKEWKMARVIRPASYRPPRAALYALVDPKGGGVQKWPVIRTYTPSPLLSL